MTDYAQDVFYYGGRTYGVGDEIEPVNPPDRKSLEERGLIGKTKREPVKGRTVVEERKANAPSEANKARGAAEENKAKGKS